MAGQLYGTNSLGGFYTNNELSAKLRLQAQPIKRFRAFVSAKGAKGAGKGRLLLFDKNRDLGTHGNQLNETSTIPETNMTVGQGTLTLNEFGAAVPWTGFLKELSEFDVEDAVMVGLKNSMAKYLDSQCAAVFTSGEFKAVNVATASVNFQTAGTASATATGDLTGFNWRYIADQMRINQIPFVDGSNYVCIGSVKLISGLFNDTAASGFVDVQKYTGEFAGQIVRGERGSYYMGRFIEETNFLPNNIGNGTAYGAGVAFGDDAIAEGVAVPEELRQKLPTDYGRSQGLAWYGILGWAKIWDNTNDGDERIVHITSL